MGVIMKKFLVSLIFLGVAAVAYPDAAPKIDVIFDGVAKQPAGSGKCAVYALGFAEEFFGNPSTTYQAPAIKLDRFSEIEQLFDGAFPAEARSVSTVATVRPTLESRMGVSLFVIDGQDLEAHKQDIYKDSRLEYALQTLTMMLAQNDQPCGVLVNLAGDRGSHWVFVGLIRRGGKLYASVPESANTNYVAMQLDLLKYLLRIIDDGGAASAA